MKIHACMDVCKFIVSYGVHEIIAVTTSLGETNAGPP